MFDFLLKRFKMFCVPPIRDVYTVTMAKESLYAFLFCLSPTSWIVASTVSIRGLERRFFEPISIVVLYVSKLSIDRVCSVK